MLQYLHPVLKLTMKCSVNTVLLLTLKDLMWNFQAIKYFCDYAWHYDRGGQSYYLA